MHQCILPTSHITQSLHLTIIPPAASFSYTNLLTVTADASRFADMTINAHLDEHSLVFACKQQTVVANFSLRCFNSMNWAPAIDTLHNRPT